jgi:DNA polymerase-3 subunit alpha
MALIIDIETTGLPDREGLKFGQYPDYTQLNKYDNSRIVQFSMMICNENFEQIELCDFIIKADNFNITNSSFHGITNEISNEQGITIQELSQHLFDKLNKVSHIISHNSNFDINILKSELYRYDLGSIISEINRKIISCSMRLTKNIVKATNKYGIKDPRLEELYKHVFNTDIQNAHNSKNDVINLYDSLKVLFDSKQIKYNLTYFDENELVGDLNLLSIGELRKLCTFKGYKGSSKMKKQEIIELINK